MTTADPVASSMPRTGVDWPLWRGRWALGWMLVCAVLVGPVGYGGQLGYAALMGVAGIATLPMMAVSREPAPAVGLLLLLTLWCWVATSWSPAAPVHIDLHRYKSLEGLTALKLVLELAVYGAFVFAMRELPQAWADRVMGIVAFSVAACAVVMTVDALSQQSLYRFFRLSAHAANDPTLLRRNAARGCYTVALFFWPTALWFKRRGWNWGVVALGLCFLIAAIGLGVDAPIVAVVLSGLALVAVQRLGRPAVWVLLAVTVVYFALAPLNVQLASPLMPHSMMDSGGLKASWGHRAEIWRFTAAQAASHPWRGVGMDSSRVFPTIPLHPHNAALQIWMELGVVGAALATLFWAWIWSRIDAEAGRSRSLAGVGAAVAVAYLTIGALSFGVWQEWWLALGALAIVAYGVFGTVFANWTEPAPFELRPLESVG